MTPSSGVSGGYLASYHDFIIIPIISKLLGNPKSRRGYGYPLFVRISVVLDTSHSLEMPEIVYFASSSVTSVTLLAIRCFMVGYFRISIEKDVQQPPQQPPRLLLLAATTPDRTPDKWPAERVRQGWEFMKDKK